MVTYAGSSLTAPLGDAQLNKKDRFGFTVNEYLALGTTGGNRKGQRMNEAQSAALKKRIQGTARDYYAAAGRTAGVA